MTQDYIGTKQITAWPQDKDGTAGYAVKYPDGYTSWSPKDTFEAAYIPLGHISHKPPHQQRVIGEKAQLDDKRVKLLAFFDTAFFAGLPTAEQSRLTDQINAMDTYSDILAARVAAF